MCHKKAKSEKKEVSKYRLFCEKKRFRNHYFLSASELEIMGGRVRLS